MGKIRASSGGGAAAPNTCASPSPSFSSQPSRFHSQGEVVLLKSLTALSSRLTSVAKLSFRFLRDNDLCLHPDQSLSLHRVLPLTFSSILSLHSTLHSSKFPPIPPPAACATTTTTTTATSSSWFLRFLASSPPDPLWLEAFRMSRSSFYLLLQLLTPSLYLHSPLPPPDHKLAAALFHLAHAAPHSSVALLFGFDGAPAACRAFHEVCRAACDRLSHLMEAKGRADGCRGVLGYTRILVDDRREDEPSSVVVQAVIDAGGRFVDVSAGWRGEMSPAQILPRTKLFASHASENGLKSGYLLGDSCCPLLPWLLTPFEDPDKPALRAFNTWHAQQMEVTATVFKELRMRWRLLVTRYDKECLEVLPFVVSVSCLLHNFLIECKEPLPYEDWEMPQGLEVFSRFHGKASEDGERVRKAVALELEKGNSDAVFVPSY